MRVKKTQYFTQFGFLNVNFVGTSGLWHRFTKILRLSNAINLCREVWITCQNLLLCLSLMITLSADHPYYAVAWHFTAFINFSVVYKTFHIYIDKLWNVSVDRFWLPTYTKHTEHTLRRLCKTPEAQARVTKFQKPLCALARQRNFQNAPFENSFLNHHWANSNVKGSKFLTADTVSMFEILPNIMKTSDRLNLSCK